MIQKFKVEIPPVAQSRPRFVRGRKPFDKTKEYKAAVAYQVLRQKPQLIESGPVAVSITFWMPIPKYLKSKVKGLWEWHVKKPDIDNLSKAVMDSLNGVVWSDDSQVCEIIARKMYAVIHKPGFTIEVLSGEEMPR